MICLYDNEEVGSASAQGAGSKLTELIMKRVCDGLGGCFEQCVANSFLVSADQGHAIHPNYPSKHEEDHQPKFHQGPILKINANQRYATTSVTSSVIKLLAKQCEVPLQELVVSNDSPCGSTIGPILSAKLGMRTVDLGGPTLSMHSCRETCCTSSVEQMIVLFRTFFKMFPEVDANMIVE
jgi:aspartyl aminopeptidase